MKELEEVLEFLQSAKPFFYATVEDGQPRVRPFGFAMIFDGKLYFGMGTHKQSYEQTVKNPHFELCACNADGRWLRLRGKAVEDTANPAAQEAAFAASPNLKNMYNETTGRTMGLFYASDATVEFADLKGGFSSVRL